MHDWIGHSRSCEIYDKKPSEPWPQNLPKKLWAPVSLWNLVDVNRMELEVIDLGSCKSQLSEKSQAAIRRNSNV